VGLHRASIWRFLNNLQFNGLVLTKVVQEKKYYMLTQRGKRLASFIRDVLENWGCFTYNDILVNELDLVETALKLGILHQSYGVISIFTPGCGGVEVAIPIAGILCPRCNKITPLPFFKSSLPAKLTCASCGEEYLRQGILLTYLPASFVEAQLQALNRRLSKVFRIGLLMMIHLHYFHKQISNAATTQSLNVKDTFINYWSEDINDEQGAIQADIHPIPEDSTADVQQRRNLTSTTLLLLLTFATLNPQYPAQPKTIDDILNAAFNHYINTYVAKATFTL
jgi:hypothetical protein